MRLVARKTARTVALMPLLALATLLLLGLNTAVAQPNLHINYQGKLTDTSGVAVADGTYNMWFFLYNTTGGATTTNIWEEQLLVGSSEGVTVTNGLFSVMLGSTSPLTNVDFNQTLYLGVEIGSTTTAPTWDGEMAPRKTLGTVPAAFEARQLDGLATTSFLRADQADTMEATSAGTLLTLIQNGAGAILSAINSSAETVFSIFDSGIVAIGTSTDANIATSTGLAVYNKDVEIIPGNPVKVGGVDADDSAYAVAVSGNYAYVVTESADGADDLEIFDISDPTNPTKVGGAAVADGANDVAVKGNYAYVVSYSTGDDLEIFDISDPTNPTKVGGAEAGDSAFGVAIAGNYAYVVSSATNDDLEIFDVSDPTNPTKVGGVDTADAANDVTVSGSFAYVVSNSTNDDIEVFDISNPTNPTKVGGTDASASAIAVDVAGTYAYVTSGFTGGDELEIFDISDPATPVKVGGADVSATGRDIQVVGDYAYIASDSTNDDLEVFDISSSTNPVKMGGADAGATAYGVSVLGNYAYVVSDTANDDLEIFDLGGLITPTAEIGNLLANDIETDYLRVTQSLTTDGSLNVGTNALIGGSLTITGTASSSLQSGNTNPALVVTSGYVGIGTSTPYTDLSVDGDLALTGGLYDSTAALGTTGQILQTSGSLTTWVSTSTLNITPGLFTDGGDITYLTSLTDVLAIGTSTDIATSTGLAVYNKDIEILPGNPVTIGNWDINNGTLVNGSKDVHIVDDIAYVMNTFTNNVVTVDVSDKSNPVMLGDWTPVDANIIQQPWNMTVVGNYAYVAAGNPDNMVILDISDPTNPTLVGNWDPGIDTNEMSFAADVAVAGNYAYVAGSYSDNLAIVDISDPTNPTLVGNWDPNDTNTMEDAFSVEVQGRYAYVAGYTSANVAIVDISDPANPITVGNWDPNLSSIMAGTNNLKVSGKYIYVVGDSSNNLAIVDISSSTNPTLVGNWDPNDTGIMQAATGLHLAGNYAFVSGFTSNTVAIVDISSSTNPTLAGLWDPNDVNIMSETYEVTVNGNYAYAVGRSSNNMAIIDLGGLITPTAEIGNLLANDIESDFVRVTQNLTTDGSLNVGTNALIQGALTITGTASSSLQAANTNPALVVTSGYVGIGTTSPYADLSVAGNLALTGGLYDSNASLGTSGQILQTDGTNVSWVATSSLNIVDNSLFTDGGDITYLTSLTDVLAIGTSTNIATSTGLAVYNKDIEILPGNPVKVGGTDTTNDANDIAVVGNYAYVVSDGGTNGLEIFDISDKSNPVEIGAAVTDDSAVNIAVAGNYAYVVTQVAGNDLIEVFDISDPTNPTEVSSFELSDSAFSIHVDGNYAYVTGGARIDIIDISDPINLVGAGSGGTDSDTYDVAVVGNYAYVVSFSSGDDLEIFDISDSTNPIEVGGAQALSSANGIDISGNYAYVTTSANEGLSIFDISDPTAPAKVGVASTSYYGQEVTVAGNYAFVASGNGNDGAFEIFNISSSTNPAKVGEYLTVDEAKSVAVAGNYAYITSDFSGEDLEIFDLGGLITPTAEIGNLLANDISTDYLRVTQALVADSSLNVGTNAMIGGTLTITGNASSSLQGQPDVPALAVTSGNVVIGSVPTTTDIATSTGLAVYNRDIEILPGSPVKVSVFDDGGNAYDVAVVGDYAYVAEQTGLEIIDISDPNTPIEVGSFWDGGTGEDIVIEGNFAYLAESGDGLEIIDISNPTNPVFVGRFDDGANVWQVDVVGDYAFVAGEIDGLEIIDISDPTNPVEVGSYDDDGSDASIGVTVSGNFAYVADYSDGLEIIDISDPTNPIEVGTFYDGGIAYDIYISGNYAYIADSGDGLEIIDISDPANPTQVGQFDNGGAAYDVKVIGNYAYVADASDGLEVIDISSSTNPVLVGSYADGDTARGVAVWGNYAYVADQGGGLEIFDLGGLITPTAEIGNLLANDIESDYVRVTQNLTTDGSLNVGTNALIQGALTITGTASSSLQSGNTNPALVVTSGYVGIGTTSPYANLSIDGDLALTGGLYDSNASLGTSGQVLQTTGSVTTWVSTSSLNIIDSALFTDGGDITYLTSLTDVLAIGTSTGVATSTGLAVYNRDIEVLAGTPVFMGSTTVITTAQDAVIDGAYLYAAINGGSGNQLIIYDISNPAKPTEVSSPSPSANAAWVSIAKQGNYIYGGNTAGEIFVFDVSNPSAPEEISELTGPSTQDPYELLVDGKYLYAILNGATVRVVDISDPTNLREVGKISSGNARRGALQGNYLYITDQDSSGDNLYVVDVSDPTDPITVSTISDGEDRDAIAVSGNRMYVSTEATPGVLEVYDISDPATVTLMATTSINDKGQDIVPVGNYLYIGNGSTTADNLQIYDVSSSTNPMEIASLRVAPEEATDLDAIVVQGGYLYAVDNTLEVYKLPSVITPTAEIGNLLANDIQTDYLRVTQSLTTDGGLNVGTNALIGGALTITGTASSSLQAGNTNPALVVTSGYVGIGTTSPYADLSVDGDLALTGGIYDNNATLGNNGEILVSTGSGLAWTATTTIGGSLFTDGGDISYLTSLTDVLAIGTSTDIATSTGLAVYNKDIEILLGAPVEVGRFDNGTSYGGITKVGDYVYIAGGSGGLEIIDVSDPANLTQVDSFNDGGEVYGVAVQGNYAFTTDDADHLQVIDISNPTDVSLVGEVTDGSGSPDGITISGNYAYYADYADGLEIVDISDPTNPVEVGELYDGGLAYHVAVKGNYAYVADGTNGLEIIDISDPTNPFEVGSAFDASGQALGVAVSGNFAYVAESDDGLEIVNVSDPANPVEVGHFYDGGNADDVAVIGRYALVADSADGLEVIDVSSTTNPVKVASYTGSTGLNGVVVDGNYVYLSAGTDGMIILDLGGLITPTAEIGNLLANDISTDYLRVTQSLTTDGGLNVGTNALIGGALTISGNELYPELKEDLVAHWTFDSPDIYESGATTSVNDRSPQDNDGDLASGVDLAKGKRGQGATFDNSDYLVASSTGLSGESGTIAMWYKPDVTTAQVGFAFLAGKYGTGHNANEWYMDLFTDNNFFCGVNDSSGTTHYRGVAASNFWTVGEWVHIVCTWDESLAGNNVRMYFNNVEYSYAFSVGMSDWSANTWQVPENLYFGNDEDNLSRSARGTLDDIRVYNAVLSDSERESLYRFGASTTNPALTVTSGYVGIGTTSPYADLSVAGNLALTGGLYDSSASLGTSGQVLQTDGTNVSWVATSSLNLIGGGLFTDGGDITYLNDLTDEVLAIGTSTDIATSTGLAVYNKDVEILPGDPVKVGGIDLGDNASAVSVVGNYAYVGTAAGDELEIIDISDPTSPTLLGGVSAGSSVQDLEVVGNYVFAVSSATNDDLEIFDVTDKTNPVKVGGTQLVEAGWGIEVVGNYAYAVSLNGAGTVPLEIFDISDPTNPFKVAQSDVTGVSGRDIDVVGNYVYFVSNDAGGDDLEIYDISDPTNPFKVGGAEAATDARSVQVVGKHAYVGTLSTGDDFEIFDISDPSSPTLRGSINMSERVNDLWISGNYAFLATDETDANDEELEIVDISSSTNPVKVGGVHIGADADAITVAGNYVYVTTANTDTDDLVIFDLGGLITPTAEIGNLVSNQIQTDFLRVTQSLMSDSLNVNTNGMIGGTLTITGTASSSLIASNGNTALTITSGFIEIGTSTNATSGIQIGYGAICVDNDGECSATTTGRISSVSSYQGNSDIAESYFSADELEPGEIVQLAGELSVRRATLPSLSDTEVEQPGQASIIGVVSTKPGILLGFDDVPLIEGERQYPIALKGRVPVKVSTENGPIKAGDSLMLSSIPGTAMKATGTGAVVGIALESFTPTTTTYYSTTYVNQYLDDLPSTEDAEAVKQTLEDTLVKSASLTEPEGSVFHGTSQADEPEVKVGQIVMFVDLSYRYVDNDTSQALSTLMGPATLSASQVSETEAGKPETLMDRIFELANNFVDGVLSIFILDADEIEVREELCVQGVCIEARELEILINSLDSGTEVTVIDDGSEDDISVGVNDPTSPVSTTTQTTGTTTSPGDNTATSSPEVGDNESTTQSEDSSSDSGAENDTATSNDNVLDVSDQTSDEEVSSGAQNGNVESNLSEETTTEEVVSEPLEAGDSGMSEASGEVAPAHDNTNVSGGEPEVVVEEEPEPEPPAPEEPATQSSDSEAGNVINEQN